MALFALVILAGFYNYATFTRMQSKGERGNIRGKENTDNKKPFSYNETSHLEAFPYLFDSNLDIEKYEVKGPNRFGEWRTGNSPYKINQDVKYASDEAAKIRKEHVKNAMKHVWKGYRTRAFGYDELLPVSGGKNTRWMGVGMTLVDSLDTLWLMDMKDEFYDAMEWVNDKLFFHTIKNHVSVFETTIRCLGGLLSAYNLSGEDIFLNKAQDIGDRLFHAFETDSGVASGEVNMLRLEGNNEIWLEGEVSLAAATTLQLEFRYLAKVTGQRKYAVSSEKVFKDLYEIQPEDGLYPSTIYNNRNKAKFGVKEPRVSFGGLADSFYEYMLKIWLQGNKKETMYREMYDRSMQGMHDKLLREGDYSGLLYIGQFPDFYADRSFNPSMDHLVCFMGGLLALGAYTDPDGLESKRAQRDLKTAKALTYSCYQMYAATPTGLSPEVVDRWEEGPHPSREQSNYILRPETVESFYILHQLTGDPIYREWGWEIFQSIEKFCKTEYAYGSYPNVNKIHLRPEDSMESFFPAETLKYLYLLFDSDDKIDILGKYVLNTEAHPFPIFSDDLKDNGDPAVQ